LAVLAIYHFQMKTVSRSEGRSATAAAAYRAGQRIEDVRTGQTFDYSKRTGVLMAEVITPSGQPVDRAQLWNVAEAAEKRCNSVVAREFVVALPHELSQTQQTDLVKGYAQGLSERTGWAVDVAIHAPGKEGDLRNTHAHLLCTTRIIERDPSGCPVAGSKTRDWDIRSSGSILLRSERAEWERCVNQSLEQANRMERVDCRSHAEKQTGLEPQIHLGPTVMAMERNGIQTERGDEYREIAAHNENVLRFHAAQSARIDEEFEQLAWQHKMQKMNDWPVERLKEVQVQYQPPSIEALLGKEAFYQLEQATLSQLALEKEQLLEGLQQNEALYTETVYQWNLFLVTHPWQSVLNDLGVLPVGEVSRLKQSFQTVQDEEARLKAELMRNESQTQDSRRTLDAYLEKALPEAREEHGYQLERFQALEALIHPKQAAQEREQLEADVRFWSAMSLPALAQEAKRYGGWTARDLAWEKPDVQEARWPLWQYSETRRVTLEKGLQQAEAVSMHAQRQIQQWKETHPVQALLCDKGLVYPGGDYAKLLKAGIEGQYHLVQAKAHLKSYERGRAKAEAQLEKAIQRVLPECEKAATAKQERYLAIQRVLEPRQAMERKLQEEKAKVHEQSRGGGRSIGR
jgi:hypothetical protein